MHWTELLIPLGSLACAAWCSGQLRSARRLLRLATEGVRDVARAEARAEIDEESAAVRAFVLGQVARQNRRIARVEGLAVPAEFAPPEEEPATIRMPQPPDGIFLVNPDDLLRRH